MDIRLEYARLMRARRHEIRPLFIVAPSPRCGTTLVQRLLNASRQILIYGEDNMLWRGLPHHISFLSERATVEVTRQRQGFVDGNTDDWSIHLLPDPNAHARLAAAHLLQTFDLYDRDAARLGFSRWGTKYPLSDTTGAEAAARALPRARFLVVYRHVAPALASAKARRFVTDEASARQFVERWSANLSRLADWQHPHKHMLRYEDLLVDPDQHLAWLAGIAEVEHIPPEPMAAKINTFRISGPGFSPSGYVEPAELTAAERTLALSLAEPGLRAGGYL